MDAKVKGEWLEALRSGDYEQGVSALAERYPPNEPNAKPITQHCCLGVLCELAIKHEIIPPVLKWSHHIAIFGDEGDTSREVLPDAVQAWAGLPDCSPDIFPDEDVIDDEFNIPAGDRQNLAGLNDAGVGFDKIADLIEKWL